MAGVGDDDGYNEPWRVADLQWDEQGYLNIRASIAEVCSQLSDDDSQGYKIALVGCIYSGKSSVINTILTALRNQQCHQENVFTSEIAVDSNGAVTTQLGEYRFRESVNDRSAIRVTLCDSMGFMTSSRQHSRDCPSLHDMENLMDGCLKDGYRFNHGESMEQNVPFINNQIPGQMDKVHAFCLVIDACTYQTILREVWEYIYKVIQMAKKKGIRCAVILTKIDSASGHVNNDLTLAFQCPEIKACAYWAMDQFGIHPSNIFPMQNYVSREQSNLQKNILALFALENILHLAHESLAAQTRNTSVDMEHAPRTALLDTPWQSEDLLTQEAVETMTTDLLRLEPDREGVPKLRLCYVGPSNAGKSAYINSVISALYKRVKTSAETGWGENPTTTRYKEYILRQGRRGPEIKLQLADTMGMQSTSHGILTEDIATVLDGLVEDNTAFNPRHPLPSSEDQPSLERCMHLLVLVVNGAEFGKYPQSLINQMKDALNLANAPQRQIPRVVLVTHIDHVCEHVAQDATNVYRSQRVQQCLESVHQKLQVPIVDIWPIYNTHNDTEIDWRKSALVLQALTHQVECAQDYIATVAPREIPAWKKWWSWLAERVQRWFNWH